MSIADLIKKSGKSRAEICKEVGIGLPTISRYVSGERQVGPDKLKLMSEALNVSARELRPDLAELFE